MLYDEKREIRLQISQMLADAGLNQKSIKDTVNTEISNKVDRAIDQCITSLNSECSSGDYVKERILKLLQNTYLNQSAFSRVVKEEMMNKMIKVTLSPDVQYDFEGSTVESRDNSLDLRIGIRKKLDNIRIRLDEILLQDNVAYMKRKVIETQEILDRILDDLSEG